MYNVWLVVMLSRMGSGFVCTDGSCSMPSGFLSPCWFGPGKPGDRFFPQGMKGKSKKLQDFFTDRKVARRERGKIPLLVAPEGILWVVGMRQDERFVVRAWDDELSGCLGEQQGLREGVEGAWNGSSVDRS